MAGERNGTTGRGITRRQFLTGGVAAGAMALSGEAEARGNHELPPEAMGLLYDSTLCTGCKACVTACKEANGFELACSPATPYLDPSQELSHDCFNVIKMFSDGVPKVKDREQDGFAFFKHSCMHCVDPACVSCCPVQALQKQPDTGVVTYNKDACIGCRYCMFSCPYEIPQFNYDDPFPQIRKCQLCDHLWEEGKFSACADACPTGATLYGPVRKLQAEAERRLALAPGEITRFPLRSTEVNEFGREMPAAKYIQHIYGEKEGGGTQLRMLTAVPFDKLGLPDLPERSFASISETIQHTLYKGLALPVALFSGLAVATFRTTRQAAVEASGEHHEPAPLGGPFLTPVTATLGGLVLLALVLLGIRFVFGMGAVSNLNAGYPWGIWVVFDIVIGSAFACGGYAMALLTYVFNQGRYHPLVRPALLASMFGYTLAGVAVFFDLGRWWNFWHTIWPSYVNVNSVMFEVAACVALYVTVMWIEFTPAFAEKFGWKRLREGLDRVMYLFLALGIVLPSMHQSSLGTLLVVAGKKVHPLWWSELLPLFYLATAILIGMCIVVFEASLSAEGFRRPRETHILKGMYKVIIGLTVFYLVARFADIAWRGELPRLFDSGLLSAMFWIEIALFTLPLVVLLKPRLREDARWLFVAAVCLLVAGSLYRVDAMLVAYNPGEQYSYFPSIPEMLITVGMASIEILAYILFVRWLPVLPKAEQAGHGG